MKIHILGRNALNCALYLKFNVNLTPLNLESKIRDVGDLFTLKLYESFLNYIDDEFKNSKERKKHFLIKETRKRTYLNNFCWFYSCQFYFLYR